MFSLTVIEGHDRAIMCVWERLTGEMLRWSILNFPGKDLLRARCRASCRTKQRHHINQWNKVNDTWMNSWDDTHPSEVSPVQQVRESLCAVALDYSLSTRLLAVWKHELSQLVTRLVRRTEPPVHNVDSYNTCRYNSITSCIRFSVLYRMTCIANCK